MLRFFCEDDVLNPANRDVLTPMVRVYLSPASLEAEDPHAQARRVVGELRALPPELRALSIQWILARTNPNHAPGVAGGAGVEAARTENLARQLVAGAFDVEREVDLLAPIGEALARERVRPVLIYTNCESWIGCTWGERYRGAIELAMRSLVFVERLPPLVRGAVMERGAGVLFNSTPEGDYNTRFDRQTAGRFNGFVAEMMIRAVREVLRRSGLVPPINRTVCVQSFAVRPRVERACGWFRHDLNPFLQRETVDGYTGNDQEFFYRGPGWEEPAFGGCGWPWAAILNAVANARSHLATGGAMVPGSGISGYVPTIGMEGCLPMVSAQDEPARVAATGVYLRHFVAGGGNTVGVFNPRPWATAAAEDRLAALVRELMPLEPAGPGSLGLPGMGDRVLSTAVVGGGAVCTEYETFMRGLMGGVPGGPGI